MSKIQIHDKIFRTFITNADLMAAIEEVANKLNRDFKDSETPPVLLCTLNGALPFTTVLMQKLSFDHELNSIRISTYNGTQSTGIIKRMGPASNVAGKDVIVCEDIVDTGFTIRALRKILKDEGVRSVKICSMLYKPDTFSKHMTPEEAPEYYGLAIPNEFIVGFGLDYNELGRNYQDIYVLDE